MVSEGDLVDVELLHTQDKTLSFDVLLLISDDKTTVGKPIVDGVKVTAEVIEESLKADKVTSIRYKAKKRVHKIHGHRQNLTKIKIKTIK